MSDIGAGPGRVQSLLLWEVRDGVHRPCNPSDPTAMVARNTSFKRTATALIGFVAASGLGAQTVEPTRIQDCPDPCPGIEFVKVATLGDTTDPVLITGFSRLTMAPSGHFIVSRLAEPGVLSVYGRDGAFGHTVGRFGGGPGEFRASALAQRGPGGRIWILDTSNQRVTVLGRPLREGRSFPVIGSIWQVRELADSIAVLQGAIASTGLWKGGLHIVDAQGRVNRSLRMPGDPRYDPAIEVTPNGTILLGSVNEYRLTETSTDGRILRVLERHPDWFEPWTGELQGEYTVLADIAADSKGRYWVFVRIPIETVRRASASRALSEHASRFRFVVEVIDPQGPQVIAAERDTDHWFLVPIHGTDLLYSRRQTDDGYVLFDVWRPVVP